MADLIIITWRDIPSQVVAKAGRKAAKVLLSDRFQQAIDRAAMRAGKGSSDAYMEDWCRERTACSADLQHEADQAAARIESEWSDERLERVTKARGLLAPVPESDTGTGDV